MGEIIYTFGGKPYLNITNRCPCACTFCLREQQEGVGSARTLWHQDEPAWEDIERALEGFDFFGVQEAVFCGYGEPFCALENLRSSARWLKGNYPGLELRVDTNGLGDLIHGRPTAAELQGLVDVMSISLNAPDAARYQELCQSCYGEAAYEAMLSFAAQCREIYPRVAFTVVDVLSSEEIERCRGIAQGMGIALRVRHRT